ncbi:MAG: Mur ligase family protein, partial [Candidatus Kaiserbacteria bacterium]|nr:Mur ligase family protein [Candidatus Kaiserbacteria bacterium]
EIKSGDPSRRSEAEADIAVLELDSWQLQGFGDLEISPNISIFTNLLPDHQNYYRNMDEYFADKANIFKFQTKGDSLFVGRGVLERVQESNPPVTAVVPPAIPAEWKLKIPGEHNRENASFAVSALRALGIDESEIRNGIESFEGVEGRLQFIGEAHGIKIYNDNNATTPEATIAGLRALNVPGKRIILIMGGSDKGLDMSLLIKEISASCKKVLLLSGTGTSRIEKDLKDASVFENLESAFESAIKYAEAGDTILFSPAFASFGIFRNEYERNDQFVKLVKKYL